MKKILISALFIFLTVFMLLYANHCLSFALTGLNLWFQKMVPALLPFMILSGIMIRMNLTDKIVTLFRPLLQPFFHVRPTLLYAIVIGFLCGFPMGARVVADLYTRNRISRTEADYLLAFCNNIGPIYFTGFVMETLALQNAVPYLIGMYGLPLVYGIFLRFTFYRTRLSATASPAFPAPRTMGLLEALDDSITSGMESITRLGGYMIFFNLLNIIPFILIKDNTLTALTNCLLEITGGLRAIGNSNPLMALVLLSFGGFSCLAQTNSCIRNTGLSLKNYFLHKAVLTVLSLGYYTILFTFFGELA